MGLLLPLRAHAARPFVTDDARIVAPQACQLESWTQANAPGVEVWMLPACNPTGNLELTVGTGFLPTSDEPRPRHSAVVVQAKTLLGKLFDGRVDTALAAGGIIDGSPSQNEQQVGNVYLYVPATTTFDNDKLLAHINAGCRYERSDGHVRATWGLASERILSAYFSLVGEVYGTSHDNPSTQLGFRIWAIPDHVQFDAAGGIQFGDPSEHWVSIGMRLISPPLW